MVLKLGESHAFCIACALGYFIVMILTNVSYDIYVRYDIMCALFLRGVRQRECTLTRRAKPKGYVYELT